MKPTLETLLEWVSWLFCRRGWKDAQAIAVYSVLMDGHQGRLPSMEVFPLSSVDTTKSMLPKCSGEIKRVPK
jgi:hypothetical protein